LDAFKVAMLRRLPGATPPEDMLSNVDTARWRFTMFMLLVLAVSPLRALNRPVHALRVKSSI
jgi:hypothetical protein